MIILRIGFEVRLQVVDSIGEYGDLHLGGTRVARVCCIFGDQLLLLFAREHILHLAFFVFG